MVELHTLGDAAVRVGGREVRPSSPLLFASLLYLATERGRRVPRAALQELLFPKSDERSGAHSLRQLLYKLRQLGVPLEADQSGVMLAADRVRDDTSAEVAGSNGAAITAEFLPDYHPTISERYTEWLDGRRSRWSSDMRKRLVTLIQGKREALEWPAVDRYAQLLLSVDPLNEIGTFARAESAALSGGKAAALKILADYEKETGRSDLRLPAALLRRRISESVPDQPPPLANLPFLGRGDEVLALRRQIAVTRTGRPGLFVIGGDPGIGKSRLLKEVSGLAALEGMRVMTVRCQSHYTGRPLSVFIELVPVLRAAPGSLGISPTSVGMLNLLTSHSDSTLERPSDARDDITRSELLLAAIRDLVDAVAGEQPLLVAVEDAHWADKDSLRELNRLVQGVSDRALMVICTTRSPDTYPYAPSTDDRTIVRRLKPLEPPLMQDLARRLLAQYGSSPREDLVSWSVKTAGGNPLFLQMLCAHYATTGEAFAVPPDMASAVTRRVRQLPEHSRHALAFVALLGKHATLDTVRSLAGWDHAQLFDAIQRLEEESYVYQADDCIRISHDLVSESVMALIPPLSRRVMHSSVAAALEKRYDDTNDASLLWDCSEQWVLSGEPEKAIQLLRKCAQHAIRFGRASDALQLLSRAEQLAQYPSQKLNVLRDAALTARAAGAWRLVLQFIQRLPWQTDDWQLEIAEAEAHWMLGFQGVSSIPVLLNCVRAQSAPAQHRIDAAQLIIRIAHETGNADAAHEAHEGVVGLLETAPWTYTAKTLPGVYQVLFGDQQVGEAHVRTVAGTLPRLESVVDEIRTAYSCATMFILLGAFDDAATLLRQYYAKCEALGLTSWRIDLALQLAGLHSIAEDFGSAEYWIAQSRELVAADGTNSRRASLAAHGLDLAIAKRDTDAADRCLAELRRTPLGDSLRGRAFIRGSEIRARQLDPDFLVDDDTLQELTSLHQATRALFGADALTVALAEALRRRNDYAGMSGLITEYITCHRRERSVPPPTIRILLQRLSASNTTG